MNRCEIECSPGIQEFGICVYRPCSGCQCEEQQSRRSGAQAAFIFGLSDPPHSSFGERGRLTQWHIPNAQSVGILPTACERGYYLIHATFMH